MISGDPGVLDRPSAMAFHPCTRTEQAHECLGGPFRTPHLHLAFCWGPACSLGHLYPLPPAHFLAHRHLLSVGGWLGEWVGNNLCPYVPETSWFLWLLPKSHLNVS